jgi:hypothetical protein
VTGFRAFLKESPPTSLGESLEPLTAAFNVTRGPRLLAILSPTGDAKPLQQLLPRDSPAVTPEIFVVWSPLSAGDDEAAARAAAERLAQAHGVRQFWDPSRRVRQAFREDENVCLFFGGDAQWTAQTPKPERVVRR